MDEFLVECSNCSGLDVGGSPEELLIAMNNHICLDEED
jgi:hypothetical protein